MANKDSKLPPIRTMPVGLYCILTRSFVEKIEYRQAS